MAFDLIMDRREDSQLRKARNAQKRQCRIFNLPVNICQDGQLAKAQQALDDLERLESDLSDDLDEEVDSDPDSPLKRDTLQPFKPLKRAPRVRKNTRRGA